MQLSNAKGMTLACALMCVPAFFGLQDGQEFLKLLLSKLEVVFGASQREVSTNKPEQLSAAEHDHAHSRVC